MSFEEYCGQVPGRAPRLQIFATDLNEAALEKARRGFTSELVRTSRRKGCGVSSWKKTAATG